MAIIDSFLPVMMPMKDDIWWEVLRIHRSLWQKVHFISAAIMFFDFEGYFHDYNGKPYNVNFPLDMDNGSG